MDITDKVRNGIAADFAAFADANTPVELRGGAGELTVSWVRDDRTLTVSVRVDDAGEPETVTQDDGPALKYRSFFASPQMADLAQLARTIARAQTPPEVFVTPRVKGSDSALEDGVDAVLDQLRRPGDTTTLLFITGEAGAGKSQLLTACAFKAAESYLETNTGSLLLYVNAQGRGLARLTEALAAETQDLRTRFTYHAVSRLARLGLIHLVIDGFDELIGGQGTYEDAFGSLAAFVEELDGRGGVVAAARSIYFEQEFLQRVNRSAALGSALWTLTPLEAAPWTDAQVGLYVDQFTALQTSDHSVDSADLRQFILGDQTAALRSKPFFVAKLCELYSEGAIRNSNENDATSEVVRAYVAREVGTKLVDVNRNPYLTDTQFITLLEGVAEEMWLQETREIHARSLRELFDVFGDEMGLSEAHRVLLFEQATSRALLQPGRKPQTVSFEHELFFGYFLAPYLSDKLDKGPQATAEALSRGNVPLDAAIQLFGRRDLRTFATADLFATFADSYRRTPRAVSLVRENVGTLAIERLKNATDAGRATLVGCIVGVADTPHVTIAACDFIGVEFRRSDLRGTEFEDCSFKSCTFEEIKISGETRFVSSDFGDSLCSSLMTDDGSGAGPRSVFDPARVNELLTQVGAIVPDQAQPRRVAANVLDLLDLLMREYRRSNLISDDRESYPRILLHPAWATIYSILVENGLIVQETRSASGPRKKFLRRTFIPDQFMAGITPGAVSDRDINGFWDAVELT